MNDDKLTEQPCYPVRCGGCDEWLMPDELGVIYDGEWCHAHCAADAIDHETFGSEW